MICLGETERDLLGEEVREEEWEGGGVEAEEGDFSAVWDREDIVCVPCAGRGFPTRQEFPAIR